MAELGRGVKAGAIAGAISGFVIIMITFIIASIFSKNKAELFTFSVIALLFVAILILTLKASFQGLIVGVIFSLLYKFIPTQKSIYKAIIFSLLVATIIVGTLLILERVSPGSLSKYAGIGNYSVNLIILILLVEALFRGYLLGYFWDKFATTV